MTEVSLTVSVSEQLTRVGEEVLVLLEQRSGRTGSGLRLQLSERLEAAARRIVGLLEGKVEELQRQLERQNRLLEAVLSPVVRLHRTDSIRPVSTAKSPPTVQSPPTAESPPAAQRPPPAPPSSGSSGDSDDDWNRSNGSSSNPEPTRMDGGRPVAHRCAVCGKTFQHKGNLVKHAETHPDKPECGVCGGLHKSADGLLDHLRTHRETRGGGTCKICWKTFQNIKTHMRSHTGVKPFSCDVCCKKFPRPGALRRHKKIHSRRMLDVCPVCGLTFTQNQLLQDHLKTHKDDQSEEEDGPFEKPKTDRRQRLGQKPPSWLCCRVCSSSFHSRGFLRKHAETHRRDAQSICGVCGQQLDSPDVLLTHLQSHRETGGTCSVCGKSFQNMETHMRSHTGVKPYSCTVCSKRFPRPGALRRHKKIHGDRKMSTQSRTPHKSDPQSLSPELEEGAERCHCCKVCTESFQSKGSLRKHARSHLAESTCGVCGESLPPSEALTDHLQMHRDAGKICHVCGKTYQNIETHMRAHTGIKPYCCTICSKSFPRSGALRRHKRIHSGERPYICEFCGKMFIDNGALRTHIKNHTGVKPAHRVSCDTCGKSLASVHVLEVHKRIHTGEKPFQCRVCGKAFRQAGGLNAHMLTHTGEKPFSCSLCNKSFSTKGYLETHIRFHKKERAFSCHLCWKAFVTKNDLKKHLLTHSGEKPFSCRVCGKSYQEKRSRDMHLKVHLRVHLDQPEDRRSAAVETGSSRLQI